MATVPATDDKPTPWSFGLRPRLLQLANMSAVGLVLLMFYQDRHQALDQAREDRQLFREAIQRLHEDSDRQWHAIRQLTTAVRRLADDATSKEKPHP